MKVTIKERIPSVRDPYFKSAKYLVSVCPGDDRARTLYAETPEEALRLAAQAFGCNTYTQPPPADPDLLNEREFLELSLQDKLIYLFRVSR